MVTEPVSMQGTRAASRNGPATIRSCPAPRPPAHIRCAYRNNPSGVSTSTTNFATEDELRDRGELPVINAWWMGSCMGSGP